MTGPITMVDWSNPHVHVMMEHQGATWEATLAPLFRMQARGLEAEMLKAGTVVSIEGYPSTRTKNEMRAERITIAGRTVELR
jgi:primosomal replication protein N